MNRQIYDNYVLQVVKHGSLTNAAKALKITQPALTQGLNSLEKEIGLKIFNRRANPITLTPEGELYYRHILRLEVLNDSFEKELSHYRNLADERVVIGAPAVYVSTVITPALRRLKDIRVSVKTAAVETLVELACSGKVDCFVSTTDELPANFSRELICQEEIVLCAPMDQELKGLQDLNGQRMICLEEEFPLQQAVDRYLQEKGIRPEKSVVIDQVSEAVSMAEQGIGFCFASREAAAGKKVRTIPTAVQGRKIYLACDKELFQTRACRLLMGEILNRRG